MSKLTSREGSEYGKRSARRRTENSKWCIEGEYVTIAEIGARIGMSEDAARNRLQRLKSSDSPTTWAALEGNR